jgi:spoIIIJ-associated protein
MTDYEKIEKIKKLIEELLSVMGFKARVEYEESITKGLIFNIFTPDSYLLIGRQGTTLHAMQILVQSIVSKQMFGEGFIAFSLDVDDYKIKREWFLKETVKAAVDHMKKTGRSVRLEPMPSYERRFVHAFLQEHFPEVVSESFGQEPRRRIVLNLKK